MGENGERSFARRRRSRRDVSSPKSRPEPQCLIECGDTRIRPAALHQNVVAVSCPGLLERGGDHSLAVAPASELRVRGDIFQETVTLSSAQKVRRGYQHACRGDPISIVRHEDMDTRVLQRFPPDIFHPFPWLRDGAHFRDAKKLDEGHQIGSASEAGWHR